MVSGGDTGLTPVEPDGQAVPLPSDRPLGEEDIVATKFDTAFRGYRMSQVDQALQRAAYDIGYKGELIGVLEAEVAALREGRIEDADVLRRAREAAVAPPPAEPPAAGPEASRVRSGDNPLAMVADMPPSAAGSRAAGMASHEPASAPAAAAAPTSIAAPGQVPAPAPAATPAAGLPASAGGPASAVGSGSTVGSGSGSAGGPALAAGSGPVAAPATVVGSGPAAAPGSAAAAGKSGPDRAEPRSAEPNGSKDSEPVERR
jgi:DivIVA domain-containing protein